MQIKFRKVCVYLASHFEKSIKRKSRMDVFQTAFNYLAAHPDSAVILLQKQFDVSFDEMKNQSEESISDLKS